MRKQFTKRNITVRFIAASFLFRAILFFTYEKINTTLVISLLESIQKQIMFPM